MILYYYSAWKANKWLDKLPPPAKKVAVVVPFSSRPDLAPEELISLRHLERHLSAYDVFAVLDPDVDINLPESYTVVRMNKKFFGSGQAHALMQLSPEFYERFIDYQYILMYHTDALVFSDSLNEWCDRGVDFVGPPWIQSEHTHWVKGDPVVGNSGFALMNVRSFLRVLYSLKKWKTAPELMEEVMRSPRKLKSFLVAAVRTMLIRNNVRSHIRAMLKQGHPGDFFWGREAVRYYSDFKIPSGMEALDFGFEVEPSRCFEMNGRKMPFGCHAWERYDRSFWEPHLLPVDTDGNTTAR